MVYEITKGRINDRAIKNDKLRSVDVRSFDFSCPPIVTTLDMHQGNEDGMGEFTSYSFVKNQKLVDPSLKHAARPSYLRARLKSLAHYTGSTVCME